MQGKLKFKLTTEVQVDSHTTVITETITRVKIDTYSTSILSREMFKQMAFRFLTPPAMLNSLRYRGHAESLGCKTLVDCDVILGSNKIRRQVLTTVEAFVDAWKHRGQPVDSFLTNAKPIVK